MPRTAFTARPDQIVFYLLLSGNQKTVSAGIQTAVSRLTKDDPDMTAIHHKAQWIVRAVEAELRAEIPPDEDVTQEMVLRRVLDELDRFLAMWENEAGNG